MINEYFLIIIKFIKLRYKKNIYIFAILKTNLKDYNIIFFTIF